jgi:hypothetical protein
VTVVLVTVPADLGQFVRTREILIAFCAQHDVILVEVLIDRFSYTLLQIGHVQLIMVTVGYVLLGAVNFVLQS